ncbi:methyltransferase domain-containing protein [Streptomyces coeruleorubidus]|uniref:methyltransferase domain-containing protein n=1 Tax=Streptomyces coeruleorubidus TaxID=116188 RepID=UPI00379A53B6
MASGKAAPSDVSALYDGIAQVVSATWGSDLHFGYWESEQDTSSVTEATERLTDMMTAGLSLAPGQRVLDIGCGIGNPAMRVLGAHDVTVQGITVSEAQVAEATARAAAAGLGDRATFRYADAMDMPFPDASFDGAWALESMAHMPDCERMLAETARVLRPGARLAVADLIERGPVGPDAREAVDRIRETFALHTLGTVRQYEQWLTASGFVDVRIQDISDHVLPRTGVLMADAVARAHDKLLEYVTEEQADAIIATMRMTAVTPAVGYMFLTAVRS